jgi:hypothetical protein|tara:strand:- start:1253 stop:1519 length:267 start_codon:yes stop_codon:yes gene_type:complete
MSVLKLKGTQAACATTTGAASTFGSATVVRLINGTTAAHLVTLEQTDGTDIGTVTIAAGESILLKKFPTDQIFAANAGVLGVAVSVEG